MARTYSEMVPLGTPAPAFDLPIANPDVDDFAKETRSLDDYAEADVLVVAFLCNHCPYVQAIEDRLVGLAREMAPRGVQFVGICSNDAEAYPDDSFEAMTARAEAKRYPFPYLRDDSQAVARAYDAACTPEFYVYGPDRRLAYRGRLDDGRPGREPATTDLRDALDELLERGEVTGEQVPSMGCSIKWKRAA